MAELDTTYEEYNEHLKSIFEVDENNKPIYQSVDLTFMIPCLTAAIKELIAKVEVLENELTALRTE